MFPLAVVTHIQHLVRFSYIKTAYLRSLEVSFPIEPITNLLKYTFLKQKHLTLNIWQFSTCHKFKEKIW